MQSISRKVLIFLALALSAVFVVSLFISYQLQSSSAQEQWENTRSTLSNELKVILTEPVYSYDKPLIESIITAFLDDKNISKINVLDHRSQILASAGKVTAYSVPAIKVPLVWDGKDIGAIQIELSTELRDQQMNSILWNIFISLVLFVIAAGALSMLIVNKLVVTPLNSVNRLLEDVAKGNGDLTKRINYASNDEIGKVVVGFNHFIEKVQSLISDVAQTAQGLDEVSQQVKSAGEHSKTEAEKEFMLTESALEHLSQLTIATNEIAQNASSTASNSQTAKEVSHTSQSHMNKNVQQVNNLITELDQTATVVSELNSASANITGVLDVIKSIAEQTNLLALNAAIEAARAGEQGRGFAVVADEVRTLAQRTQESTKEIEDIIGSLQEQAKESVSATTRSQDLAQLVIESSRVASETLDRIAEDMNAISDMNNMIASASEEQSLVTQEVKTTMETIHDGAESLSKEAGQLEEGISNLSSLESSLMTKIQQFKY